MVGKHGLFTLLENELRNVKHFEEKRIEEMRKYGLNVVLTFMPVSLQDTEEKSELYEIGIWLKHKTALRTDGNDPVIRQRFEGVNKDIINDDLKPRLGGTSQDKLCAAMLFNNNFDSVQNKDSLRDKLFYPWVMNASASDEAIHSDYLMWCDEDTYREAAKAIHPHSDERQIQKDALELFYQNVAENYPHTQGYIKKYFYVWEGAEIYEVKNENSLTWENVSRFKFVQVNFKREDLIRKVRRKGIIRIVPPVGSLENAWTNWISRWIPREGSSSLLFQEKQNRLAAILRDRGKLTFINGEELEDIKLPAPRIIRLAHGGERSQEAKACNFRSHGTFATKFGGEKRHIREVDSMDHTLVHELYEILESQICIFDNRIFKRIPNNPDKVAFLRDSMGMEFYKEDEAAWHRVKENNFGMGNFLVMHLSFIEKMLDKNGKRYGEQRISDFISEQIPVHCQERENFIFVITTGRGRRVWWDSMAHTEHTRFTTFRPIETLITSIENAIQKHDDFELKYNLLKTLFGS